MKHILVVDDDLETCNFLTEIFSEEGWEVAASQTPEEAREAADKTHFDLIVSDIFLVVATIFVRPITHQRLGRPSSATRLMPSSARG